MEIESGIFLSQKKKKKLKKLENYHRFYNPFISIKYLYSFTSKVYFLWFGFNIFLPTN